MNRSNVKMAQDSGKLLLKGLQKLYKALVDSRNNAGGKRTYRTLKKGSYLSTAQMSKESLKPLKKVCKKFKIQYSLKKQKGTNEYTVFFKGQDKEVLDHALRAYINNKLKKEKKPSLIGKLNNFKEQVEQNFANLDKNKERNKNKEFSI